jgi:hypothetical protein
MRRGWDIMPCENTTFTEGDLDACWPHFKTYFLEVLNGEYALDNAREDLKSLIGTKYDQRCEDGHV